MTPLIVSDARYHYLRNSDLAYTPMTAQNAAGKNSNTHGGQPAWLAPTPNGVPRGVSADGSDLESDNSFSPKSLLDDRLGSESFSPGSMPDQASLSGDWNGYSTSYSSVKEFSPSSTSAGFHLVPVPIEADKDVDGFDFSGYPQRGLGIATPSMEPTGASYHNDELSGSPDAAHQASSEYSYSHVSSPDASPWYLPGYSHDSSVLPFRKHDLQLDSVQDDVFAGASPSQSNNYTRKQTALWNASRVGVPAQVKPQDRFQVSRSADAHTQRKHNDDLLVQGKKEGLTYKEIRKKMVGEKPAESTLRGRYRSLTKAREDRVRKPLWTPRDVS